MAPEICPNCGELVPEKARSCPECGADEETGWSDRAQAQRLGVPDDDFNYDEFVRGEFGETGGSARKDGPRGRPQIKPSGLHWIWWVAGVGLLLVFLYSFLRQF